MARGAGELVVSLGLDDAEYRAGLTKAERDAKIFAQRVNSAILQVGKVVGSFEIGKTLFDTTKEIIASASALNDLSSATGSSVESLSKLSNQAKIAGTDFATVENALLKLSAGMSGADSKGSHVNETLQLLGVTARDPAEALQQVAVKLATYADGTNKVAIAQRLFGESGRAFLKTLQDIAELQDVNASITAKQAREAEALEKQMRALGVESTKFGNIILGSVVPGMRDLLFQFTEGIKIAGGFWEALNRFSMLRLGTSVEDVSAEIKKMEGIIEDTAATLKRNKEWFGIEPDPKALDGWKKQLAFLKAVRINRIQIAIDPADTNVRDLLMQRKPEAPKIPDAAANAKAYKAALDEQLRILEQSIKDEQETFRDRDQFLRAYYQDDIIGLRQFFAGRNAALQESFERQAAALDAEQAQLEDAAKHGPTPDIRADAEKKLIDVIARRGRLQQDVTTQTILDSIEEARAFKQLRDSVEQAAIALAEMRGDTVTAAVAGFDFANRKLKAQLGALLLSSDTGDQTLGALGIETLNNEKALIGFRAQLTKQTEAYGRTLETVGLAQQQIDLAQQTGDITSLQALRKKSDLAAQYTEVLRAQLVVAEQLAASPLARPEDILAVQKLRAEMERLAATGDLVAQQFDKVFQDAFTQGLMDAVSGTKSLKEAWRDMMNSIVQGINRIAAQNIAEALFGGNKGQGSMLAQLFSYLFGGGGGGLGYGTAGSFDPSGGGIIITPAASGGISSGGMTLVGESGPELVNLPKGARVYSHAESQGMGGRSVSIVQNINVQPGANTQSARQIANRLYSVTSSAARER